MTATQFGAAIKAAREKQGMSVRELADEAVCSEMNLRMIENKGRAPSVILASRILDALGCRLCIGHGRRLRLEPAWHE
jgi:transcriptional regulator with XRE-family HTH domain